MLYKVILILIIISVGLFSVNAMAEDTTIRKEPPVFTNKDIEKYKAPSDNSPVTEIKIDKTSEKTEKEKKIKEELQKEHWCKKAMAYKKKVDKIKDEIAEAEKELAGEGGLHVSHKKKRAAQRKLNNAKRQLKYAENDLGDIEAEAHRKKIPPGWLRCQFE